MKIRSFALGIIVVITIFGGIVLSSALNLWKTESTKEPRKIKEGSYAGAYDPADIRGSYSFNDITKSFEIPVDVLAKAFNIYNVVENPESFKCKDLESIYSFLGEQGIEIGTSSVRMFTAFYSGLPYIITEETYLFKTGVDILKSQGNLTQEQQSYLEKHTIDLTTIITDDKSELNVEQKDERNLSSIKGKTTFQDLLDMGLSETKIKQIIGMELPDTEVRIRDFVNENGLEFSLIKEKLQEELDCL